MKLWEWLLLAAASYLAFSVLVRMMRQRRDEQTAQFRNEYRQEQLRQAALEAQRVREAEAAPKPRRTG